MVIVFGYLKIMFMAPEGERNGNSHSHFGSLNRYAFRQFGYGFQCLHYNEMDLTFSGV